MAYTSTSFGGGGSTDSNDNNSDSLAESVGSVTRNRSNPLGDDAAGGNDPTASSFGSSDDDDDSYTGRTPTGGPSDGAGGIAGPAGSDGGGFEPGTFPREDSQQSIPNVGNIVDNAVNEATSNLDNSISDIRSEIDSTISDVQQSQNDLAQDVGNSFSDIQEQQENITESIGNQLGTVSESVGNAVSGLSQQFARSQSGGNSSQNEKSGSQSVINPRNILIAGIVGIIGYYASEEI